MRIGRGSGHVLDVRLGRQRRKQSILPMLATHSKAFPPGNYVGTEDVTIDRLDSVAPQIMPMGSSYAACDR